MNKKNVGIVGGLVVVIFLIYFFLYSGKPQIEIVSQDTVTKGDIANQTLVFGKAAPQDVYELSFDVSGKLIAYNFNEGDIITKGSVIAQLDQKTVRSQISRANASVAIERSRYSDLAAPVSSQDQATKQAEKETQKLVIEGNRFAFEVAMENALRDYRDLIDRGMDRYYLYPTRPDVLLRLKEAEDLPEEERERLSQARASLENLYQNTQASADVQTKYTFVTALFAATDVLIKDISFQLENEESITARQTQDNLGDLSDDLQDLFDSLNSSYVTWNTSVNQLSVLEKQLFSLQAGADPTALGLQQSVINARRSDLNALYTDLAKLTLNSPISGIVFDAPLVNFQTISQGQVVVAITPDEPLVIKAQVAESDIQFIGPGNTVEISFDALPEEIFSGSVLEIKNRENINSAVPTYETTFMFDENQDLDSIRSGMTANITVISGIRTDVLYIPTKYIIQKSEGSFVTVAGEEEGSFQDTIVSVGMKTTSGLTEITSGLEENQAIFLVEQ